MKLQNHSLLSCIAVIL